MCYNSENSYAISLESDYRLKTKQTDVSMGLVLS